MEPGLGTSPNSPSRLRSPLTSVADIAARLVFTRFTEPFELDDGRRRWVFGGELWACEGRQTRHYWAMLFSDLLLLTVINRDRVIYVVEEPLLLAAIVHTNFNVKKHPTDLRLLLDTSVRLGTEARPRPVRRVWLRLYRSLHRGLTRSLSLRAPTPEHKATWSNLLQRCIVSSKRGSESSTAKAHEASSPTHESSLGRAFSLDALHLLRSTSPATHRAFKNKSGSFGDLTDSRRADDPSEGTSATVEPGLKKPSILYPDLRVVAEASTEHPSALNNNLDSPFKNVGFQLEIEDSCNPNSSSRKNVEVASQSDEDEPIPYERPKPDQKKKGISSRFKAKLFPAKQLPKKKVNSLKKVEKYVNSLNINSDFIETRSVTPVFEQEENLNTEDFIRKRIEFLRLSGGDSLHGCEEIVVLDMPESQEDHIEAAMERRQALLRSRDEKKNSLKLEGIQEESPQLSPKHHVTLPTPEEYEGYLDAEVEQDYPELASTPCLTPDDDVRLQSVEKSSGETHKSVQIQSASDDTVQGRKKLKLRSKSFEPPTLNKSLCNPSFIISDRARSLSDSHESADSSSHPRASNNLESVRSVCSCESHNDTQYSSSNSSARESLIISCMGSSTSGYSSMSFDSSTVNSSQKKATLFLPATTTSLPEISLQPPTPQAPKLRQGSRSRKSLKNFNIPGYGSNFLTVPGSEEDGSRYLPGNPLEFNDEGSSSGSSSSDDDCRVSGPNSTRGPMSLGLLRRFGSGCNMSSVGLTLPDSTGADIQEAEEVPRYGAGFSGMLNSNQQRDEQAWLECEVWGQPRNHEDRTADNGNSGLFSELESNFIVQDGTGKNWIEDYPQKTIGTRNFDSVANKMDLSMQETPWLSGKTSFVADKCAIFERVAEEENKRFEESQQQRKMIQKVPKMTGEYMKKFYGPQNLNKIAARASDGPQYGDYASDSEGYDSDEPSSHHASSPQSSLVKNQNYLLLDNANQNKSHEQETLDNKAYVCHYSVTRSDHDRLYSRSSDDVGGQTSSVPPHVPRLRLVSSVEEYLPPVDDDSFSLCYNDEASAYEEPRMDGLRRASSYSGDYSTMRSGLGQTGEPDTPDDNDDVFEELDYKVLRNISS
ncbi:uncharacterized protein LOC108665706 [Hyalella azteca]|uniref:Uncharacterized protein LOC108665706 n=1 Tax=Hyalella azteca TaxID=294128 RepID=A0A8B7N2B4_HYAAZ|nr:uncharacterized protein LOC108665706 [Hyalella azteca]